jgi:hypothetical protein
MTDEFGTLAAFDDGLLMPRTMSPTPVMALNGTPAVRRSEVSHR